MRKGEARLGVGLDADSRNRNILACNFMTGEIKIEEQRM